MKWGFLGAVSFGIAAAWVGCLDATQVKIEITTAYKPCGDTDTVITTGSSTAKQPVCVDQDVGGRVGSLVIVPRKSVTDPVLVRVMAGVDGSKGDDCGKDPRPMGLHCIEAKRIVHFLSHQSFTLPIELDRSCVNVDCGADTCVMGKCVNPDVPNPTCAKDITKCPMDGGIPDAALDAPMEAEVEASTDSGVVLTAKTLTTGFDNACAIASNGTLYCWGDNTHKQVSTAPQNVAGPIPIALGTMSNASLVAIGGGHICASDTKSIVCWGNNALGQSAPGKPSADFPVNSQYAIASPNAQSITSLVAGKTFTCVVAGGSTYCWGTIGTTMYGISAALSASLLDVAAGDNHVCGVTSSSVQCWGGNLVGQLGQDPQQYASLFSPKDTYSPFMGPKYVFAGYGHSAAIDANGAWAWGDNSKNVIESINTAYEFKAVSFPAGAMGFGEVHVCILNNGTVRCRGDNTYGQRGPGNVPDLDNLYPVLLPMDKGIAVGAGRTHSCALGNSGKLYCWGAGPVGPMSPNPQTYTLK